MGSRCSTGDRLTEHRRVEDQDVEAAPALGDRLGELRDIVAVVEVHRRDRRAAAGGVDPLLDLLERRRAAGGQDDVRAGRGQRLGGGGADAAAGAGDERELAVKGFVIRSCDMLLLSGWRPADKRLELAVRCRSRSAWSDNRR